MQMVLFCNVEMGFGFTRIMLVLTIFVCLFQGNAGVGYSILIIFITLLVASIGAMSAIGICERSKIESGGVYYLLSHVLGGQTASAVGILYCFGQVNSTSLLHSAFYILHQLLLSLDKLVDLCNNVYPVGGFLLHVHGWIWGVDIWYFKNNC